MLVRVGGLMRLRRCVPMRGVRLILVSGRWAFGMVGLWLWGFGWVRLGHRGTIPADWRARCASCRQPVADDCAVT